MDLELHHIDVKTVFLNGELDKEIYMEQLVYFIIEHQEHKVCRLLKSIYGLNQSLRQWDIQFHNVVMSHNFEMIEEDHCVYIKMSRDKFVILSLYVNDTLIAGNSMEYILEIKGWLSSKFEMKDMGEAAYILRVKISRDRSKKFVSLSQEKYIKKIHEQFRMQDCRPIDNLMESRGRSYSQIEKKVGLIMCEWEMLVFFYGIEHT